MLATDMFPMSVVPSGCYGQRRFDQYGMSDNLGKELKRYVALIDKLQTVVNVEEASSR